MGSVDADRRQQILDAAARLLHHYGPHKTTMAEIAREANIGVGTVYLEFPSKEAIVEELSTRRHAKVLEAMREASSKASMRASERLRALVDARVHAFLKLASDGAHAQDLVHCGNVAVKAAHGRFLEEERALIVTVLRDGERDGELDVRKAEVTAGVVLRAYASFSPPFVFSQPDAEVQRALACMHEIVLKGLVRR